jgi:hypothetical protein
MFPADIFCIGNDVGQTGLPLKADTVIKDGGTLLSNSVDMQRGIMIGSVYA